MSYSAHKVEAKAALCAGLVEQGILPSLMAAVKHPGRGGVEVALEIELEPDAKGPVNVLPAEVEPGAGEVESDAAEVESGAAEEPKAVGSTEDLRLTLRIREVEVRAKELEVQAMHLHVRALELKRKPTAVSTPVSAASTPVSSTATSTSFDITKHVTLVPLFREAEVDSYFSAFAHIAAALNWPKEFWVLLLQCKLIGKAQEVCTSLSVNDSLQYDIVKKSILHAYELVPEAYHRKFRKSEKTADQTFVEFAREKHCLFERWIQASKVKDIEGLKELVLLEEFKKCLPDQLVVYLNEQKVTSLAKAAVLADEFTFTHKIIFPAGAAREVRGGKEKKRKSPTQIRRARQEETERLECFYCRESGHLIASCPGSKGPVGLIKVVSPPIRPDRIQGCDPEMEVESRFKPFLSQGFVSVTGEEKDRVPITILRDTGAHKSFMLDDVLPLSDKTACHTDVLVWGIEMSVLRAPLHRVYLHSPITPGPVKVAVRRQLPFKGVSFILGNDLAGGKVFPPPEAMDTPVATASDVTDPKATVFPLCAVTRAQARKFADVVSIADTFVAVEQKPSVGEKDSVKK
ncbi:unnamed protein product [Oreochromis niloticus]|nr:unnamed protein product [Mustela putorius furo]